MAGTTTKGLRYPTAGDNPAVHTDFLNLATDVDTELNDYALLTAWTTYTPTFTNFTLGNGTITKARYSQVGKVVFLNVVVTLGSTSSVSGLIRFTTPTTIVNSSTNDSGGGLITDASASTSFTAITSVTSSTTLGVYAENSAGTYSVRTDTSSLIPMTWATGDVWSSNFIYETA